MIFDCGPSYEAIVLNMERRDMWTIYHIRFDGLTKLCGSVPGNPDMVDEWQNARKSKAKAPHGKTLAEINEEVLSTLAREAEEETDYQILTFQRVNNTLVMRADTVRSHIKDCARTLATLYVGKLEGESSFATRVINGVYHDEHQYWLPILRGETGIPLSVHDGEMDKAVHPRHGKSCLKRFEWVEPWRIEFRLKVLTPPPAPAKVNKKGVVVEFKRRPAVSEEDLKTIFEYGGTHGYAGERGAGEGRYMASILKIEEDQHHAK